MPNDARIVHNFVSTKPTRSDPTRVYGEQWNEDHVITGLDQVDNTSDANKPVSTAQAAAIAIVQSDIDVHQADTANPHATTKAQVGLGNADNTSDSTKWAATATLTNKTVNLTSNTVSGTTAQFNAALSDNDFATLAGTETLTNKSISGASNTITGVPISTGVSGLATGIAAFLGTPSSSNLRAALTDEVGTGSAYFVGGALGTPASGTATNLTGLPLSTGISGAGTGILAALAVNVGSAGSPVVNGGALGTPASGTLTNATGLPLSGLTPQAAYTIIANNSGSSAVPTAVDITVLTLKASPVSADVVLIQDSAASNAFKKTTVGALASAGSVASLNGKTGAISFSIVHQVFTASGTYTPTTGMVYAVVEAVGQGGGGGGVTGSASSLFAGGGGGSGSYSRSVFSAATVGASKAVVITSTANGGAAGNNNGSSGGDTTFGSTLLVAKGGSGGGFSNASTLGASGAGGPVGTGDVTVPGNGGGGGIFSTSASLSMTSLPGGASYFGGAGAGAQGTGNAGSRGGGGSGGQIYNATSTAAGAKGGDGYLIVTEYIIQ